jgi:hypothetical protein
MQVIITSDSHGKGYLLDEIERWYPHADVYLNCGDLEENTHNYPHWLFVRGNNDFMFGDDMPEERFLTLDGHKILIVHGHRFSYYQRERQMAAYALSKGCDIVCYGHSHIANIAVIQGVTLINPGSLWMSRNGKSPSFAVLNIDGRDIEAHIVYEEDWPAQQIKEEKPKKKRGWFH